MKCLHLHVHTEHDTVIINSNITAGTGFRIRTFCVECDKTKYLKVNNQIFIKDWKEVEDV